MIDHTQTLEQLENKYWGEPGYPLSLVVNCHKYRKIPVKDLTPEQLRLLIGQNIGLEYLIPIALDNIEKNIFTSGDLYQGDLLQNVLRSEPIYWEKNISNKQRLIEQLQKQNFLEQLDRLYPDEKGTGKRRGINRDLFELYNKFVNTNISEG